MLYFSTSLEISSRSSGLTTVNTTSALSSAAFSRICSSSLSRRTRENRRICTGSLNCSVAARTMRSAVSPVASLMIITVFIGASISRAARTAGRTAPLPRRARRHGVAAVEPQFVAKPTSSPRDSRARAAPHGQPWLSARRGDPVAMSRDARPLADTTHRSRAGRRAAARHRSSSFCSAGTCRLRSPDTDRPPSIHGQMNARPPACRRAGTPDRERRIAGDVRADDLAAAAAQLVIAAARARLRGVAPVRNAPNASGAASSARARRRAGGRRRGRRRRREAARGEPAIGLRADEEVAAGAAVDRELGEQRAIGLVMREHRRVRAVDLDAHAMALRRREDRRAGTRGAARRCSADPCTRAAPRPARLEAQQLDLGEPALARVREDRGRARRSCGA